MTSHGFATQGYEGTSVRDLNTRLGVSHNLINRRFGSKADLRRATADRWFGSSRRDPVVLRRHADVVADLLLGVDPSIRLTHRAGERARHER